MNALKNTGFQWLAMFLVILTSQPASAVEFQSLESIRLATRNFLEKEANNGEDSKYRIDVGRLDSRLRLAHCDHELEAFLPLGGRVHGRTTVGVRCTDKPGWTIYVPARVKLFGRVLVARQALPRGVEIPASAIKLEEREISSLTRGYLTDPDSATGKVPKSPVAAGMPLIPNNLKLPRLISRGDRVQLIAEKNGVVVKMQGEALSDGAAGDRIQIRNLSSKRKIEGVVTADGAIKLTI